MSWSNTTPQQFMPMQRREGGYVAFAYTGTLATDITVNVYTWMTKIHSVKLTHKASGNSYMNIFDTPLVATSTISGGYFTVTRPGNCGKAQSFWYEIIGE